MKKNRKVFKVEENKEKIDVEENEDNKELLEQVEAKWAFAKKWLVVCGVLLLLLIVLGITLYFVKTGDDLWEKEYFKLINFIIK